MEWVLFAGIAAVAAIYIALPRREDATLDLAPGAEVDDLRAQRDELVAALRDLDDDLAAGRVSADDRARGRREVGERLREVMATLQARERRP